MPGRKHNSKEYRYGFNGKEKDDEGEFGSITNYDYGFRIYNPAVGRFLSVDPLSPSYPYFTPYQFSANSPITFVDVDGREQLFNIFAKAGLYGGTVQAIVVTEEKIVEEVVIKPLKAATNIYSTFFTGFSYAVGTKLPQAFGIEVEDNGLGEVLTTEGFTAFGSVEHDLALKESAETVRDEIKSSLIGGAVGGTAAKTLKVIAKSKVAEKVIVETSEVFDEFIGAGVRSSKQAFKGSQKITDFISEHAHKRHKFDATRKSTRSRTQFGEHVNAKSIRDQTMNNADKVEKLVDENGVHYATRYKKRFDSNISTVDTPTRESRVIINHLNPERSTQFPLFKEGVTNNF